MKRKNKYFMALAVASALLALSGCSAKPNEAPTTAPSTQAAPTAGTTQAATQATEATTAAKSAKKITLFQSKVEIQDVVNQLAKDYQKATGVEVEVWETTGDDYRSQLMTKLGSNQGPTIFSIQPGSEVKTYGPYLADLSGLSFAGNIADGMALKLDGKLVGIPMSAEGFGFLGNPGLADPSKLATVDSLCGFIKSEKAAGRNAVEMTSEDYFLIGHILNVPFALQKDPEGFIQQLNQGQVKMADTPEFKDFAKIYAAIRDNCVNPLEVVYDKQIGDFATGKTDMIHQGNWAAGMFADYKDQMKFTPQFIPVPIDGNTKLSVAVASGFAVNSQAKPEEQQAAKDFLEWLYTSKEGVDYLMNKFKFIPVIKGMENNNLDDLSKQVAEYIKEGNTIPWAINYFPTDIIGTHLAPVAQEFFTSKMSPDDFLKALDQAWAEANK